MNKQTIQKLFLPVILPGIFVICSFVYALSLVPTQVVFGFDQARDAYEAYSIWHDHHLKILGPSSDITGINHGVLWYYTLAAAYFIGGGTPEGAAYFFLICLYLMIPYIGYATYKMSNDKLVTTLTIILYVMAPLFLAFTHWLSNPLLALYIVPPLFYLLWQYLQQQTLWKAAIIGFLYGLLIQSDFGFLVLLFTLPIYHVAFSLRFSLKKVLIFSLGLFIGILPFIISYLKFKTNIVSIISGFLLSKSGETFSPGNFIMHFLESIEKLLNFSYFQFPLLFTVILISVFLLIFRKQIFLKKEKLSLFILIWLSGIFFLFILNHGRILHNFFYSPFLYPLAFLVAINLARLKKHPPLLIIIVIVIVLLQVQLSDTWTRKTNSPLAVQQSLTTYNERLLIDYVYHSAGNEPFAISTITNPLDINTTWAYLFTFYGKKKYGSVPYFWGKDQTGYLGDLPKQEDLTKPTLRYFIIEPRAGIEDRWISLGEYKEELLSDLIEEKTFGEFVVQKRRFHPDKTGVKPPK